MLIAIVFWMIGLTVTSFTIIPTLICLTFGIPTTKKLERAQLLINDHPITKRYWISIGILMIMFVIVFGIVYFFCSVYALRGYLGGSALALIMGIWKIGKNKNNVNDYDSTQSRYFNKPVENIIDFLCN
jgi:hypothetical protein